MLFCKGYWKNQLLVTILPPAAIIRQIIRIERLNWCIINGKFTFTVTVGSPVQYHCRNMFIAKSINFSYHVIVLYFQMCYPARSHTLFMESLPELRAKMHFCFLKGNS